MVYILLWSDFIHLARDMFSKSPDTTRYVAKLRKTTNIITLKVTDNKKCIMYKIKDSESQKKMEELNYLYLNWCTIENEGDLLPLKINKNAEKSVNVQKVKKVK